MEARPFLSAATSKATRATLRFSASHSFGGAADRKVHAPIITTLWSFPMTFPPPTERQARLIWVAMPGLAIALIVSLGVALVWALGQIIHSLSPVIWPLAVAGVIACLLDPLVDWLQARGRSRRTSIATVFALAFLLLVGFFASVVPQLVDETRQLATTIPYYTSRVQKKVQEWATKPPAIVQELLHFRSRSSPPPEHAAPVTNSVTVPPEILVEPLTNEPPAATPSEGPQSLII